VDWTTHLVDQLEFHWTAQLRPRLDGLTDDEYFWEPAPNAWSVRPRADGTFTVDWAYPEPDPPPVTTIAWRLAHLIVGVFGMRAASHFGGPSVGYEACPGTADEALRQLDASHDAWIGGVRGLDANALARPVGPAEGPYAEMPMATLVLHINREAIHHGAEIALLRDLYRARGQ
jgi:DinB superfamily